MALPADKNELNYAIALLGDPIASRDDKLGAVDTLARAGIGAVPLLVERLKRTEDAVFLDEITVEHGPMNPGETTTVRATARFMCELLLYRIIAPEPGLTSVALGARSSQTGLDATRPAGGLELDVPRPPIAWVQDWSAFWAKHKSESLDVIKRWSSDEIDRVWRAAALASTTSPSPGKGAAPALAAANTGTAAALASSTAGLLLTAWRDPALTSPREAYAKARKIHADAVKDTGKRPAARKALEDAAKKEPRLKVHVERWLKDL